MLDSRAVLQLAWWAQGAVKRKHPLALRPPLSLPPRTCSACSAWMCGGASMSLAPKPPRRRHRHMSDSIAWGDAAGGGAAQGT